MALTNAERQKRFYEKRVKTGGVKRYEFRLSGEHNQVLKYLAEHWQCSLTEAFTRSVLAAWDYEGKPIPKVKKRKPKPTASTRQQPSAQASAKRVPKRKR